MPQPPDDPLSFFRDVSDLLTDYITSIRNSGSRVTDFNTGSAARTIGEAVSAVVSDFTLVVDQFRQDAYLATATGDALDLKGADYQVARLAAVPAAGKIQITRSAPGAAITIPAGAVQFTTLPAPGITPQTYVTLADAIFAPTDLTMAVDAVAVVGGVAGDAVANTPLLPLVSIAGFPDASSFKVASVGFTGGVDAESDDAYRIRIPLEVQGRVRGTAAAFLAGALSVPGVAGAQVREAGQTDAAGATIAAGNVVVYHGGTGALTPLVTTAEEARRILDQAVAVHLATATPCTVVVDVTYLAGVDVPSLTAAVKAAVLSAFTYPNTTVGGSVSYSLAVKAVHDVDQVLALAFEDFRTSAESAGTLHDVALAVGHVGTLADVDLTINLTELP